MLVKRRHSRAIPEGAIIIEKNGKPHAQWTTLQGRTYTRPLNRKGNRVVSTSDCWYVRLRLPETGQWKEWRAYHDRQASQALEIEKMKLIERGQVGLTDRNAIHRKTPLDEHLAAFEEYLEDRNNTNDHVDRTIARCERLFKKMNARLLPDITPHRVENTLAAFRKGGMSVSTSNGYFQAVRSFCRWLIKARRSTENPVAGLSCLKVTDAQRRRRRRPLTDDEAARLITTTEHADGSFMRLTGPDRAMLYRLALNTGFRASELASLTPSCFRLDGNRPTVHCLAGYTKNRQEAVLPLRVALARMLRDWLVEKPAHQPVWPGKWAHGRHGAEMLRADLAAAGIDWQDDRGRVVDFHALRHTFISNLARAGVHPRHAQSLARHSTIELTMNVYTHVAMADLADDIEKLPALGTEPHEPVPCTAATNTATATVASMPSSDIPGELAHLATQWDQLPDHVRSAIRVLTKP